MKSLMHRAEVKAFTKGTLARSKGKVVFVHKTTTFPPVNAFQPNLMDSPSSSFFFLTSAEMLF